uniref:ATP synthase F0 subunit 8 n=1 Tax=Opecarcinus hypostegus TaxID=1903098 RepID=UPI0028D5F9F7|nr:ATP synthase F0 subunit 8 [Opecarcinus hypostegus]WMY25242.1 ATP synthase F0 subunit 8 [Opecarcinus hypostegus]
MPQMAPIYWLSLFAFFTLTLVLFSMLNYFIKPFNKMITPGFYNKPQSKHWKL